MYGQDKKNFLEIHVFYIRYCLHETQLSERQKLRNSSTGKIELKKLFILIKEIFHIVLLHFHLLPVSYCLKGT